MYSYYGKFPYVIPADGDFAVVYGNLLEVNDSELAQLDAYEGVDAGLYHRIEVLAFSIETGQREKVYMYEAGNVAPPMIEDGDWAEYKKVGVHV